MRMRTARAGSTIITPVAEPICYQKNPIDCLNNPLGEIVVSVDQGLFWTTGGGFSNISSRATYQTQEVEDYLSHKNIPFPAPGMPTSSCFLILFI